MQGKLHPLPRDKLKRILLSNGFVLMKGRGPHIKFKKFDKNNKCTATTFVSHCPEIQVSSIRFIIKQSKKQEEEFY